MNMMPIELKHIRKEYERTVLEDINLSIPQGSYIAILGKSGSGKSTLLHILGLVESFTSGLFQFGEINIIKGHDYSKLRGEAIGFVFQSYNLLPSLTVGENIRMPLLYQPRFRTIDRSEEWMERLGIKSLSGQNVSVLSGGEKQKVGLARALMTDPSVLLADEPTGNLDSINRDIVLSILKAENQNGRTVILITHDTDAIKDAQIVYRLESGVLEFVQ
jgi:ABC-type lipoprotein export system ATPase subunit